MKPLSIEKNFITPNEGKSRHLPRRIANPAEMAKTLRHEPFDIAYDFLRALASTMAEKGESAQGIELLRKVDAIVAPEGIDLDNADRDLHSAILQVITALQIESDNTDEALVTAAQLLNLLAQDPKRKDEPFMAVLAALLYDIAYVHNERSQYKQAERDLEKAMKLMERLAKTNPGRYAAAHILAQNAATRVYRSRIKQVNVLAHNQVATSTYLEMLNSGIEGAADQLIDSLADEGRTLASMGRYREAVQYLSRALKYLTKIEPEFTERQLRLSVDLGEALLNVKVSRDKGIHLLNTMLHKATKLNADAEHRRIVDILLNAKSRRLDILGIWHKVFPK